MPLTPSFIKRTLGALVLLAVLVTGGLWYRTSLLAAGREAGLQEAAAAVAVAQTQAKEAAKKADEASAARHSTAIKTLEDQHAQTVRNLSQALADSDHRSQRLSARIASLLDEAAGLRAGLASAADASGSTTSAPESDTTVAAVIETTAENYAICRANAATLSELQTWYLELRQERSNPTIE